jgi:hypothetical protein
MYTFMYAYVYKIKCTAVILCTTWERVLCEPVDAGPILHAPPSWCCCVSSSGSGSLPSLAPLGPLAQVHPEKSAGWSRQCVPSATTASFVSLCRWCALPCRGCSSSPVGTYMMHTSDVYPKCIHFVFVYIRLYNIIE